MKFATRLLTFDPAPGDRYTPANTPIYQTATFRQDDATEFGEYDYSRSGNPTRAVVEKQIAALESGTRGFCFSTGLAAITAVTRLLSPGEEILACDDLYGGTYRLFSRILAKRGINVRYVDFSDLDAVAAAITQQHQAGLPGNARPIRCCRSSTSLRSPTSRIAAARWCAWTTAPCRLICSGRWSSALTSCCIRRPSFCADTAT